MFVPLSRPLLARLADLAGRRFPTLSIAGFLPGRRQLAESLLAAVVFFLLHGAAYALHLDHLSDDSDLLRWTSAYALAAGLSVATPLPAGLGVREALVVALSGQPAAEALQAALLLRLTQLVVELGLAALAALVAVQRRRTALRSADDRPVEPPPTQTT